MNSKCEKKPRLMYNRLSTLKYFQSKIDRSPHLPRKKNKKRIALPALTISPVPTLAPVPAVHISTSIPSTSSPKAPLRLQKKYSLTTHDMLHKLEEKLYNEEAISFNSDHLKEFPKDILDYYEETQAVFCIMEGCFSISNPVTTVFVRGLVNAAIVQELTDMEIIYCVNQRSYDKVVELKKSYPDLFKEVTISFMELTIPSECPSCRKTCCLKWTTVHGMEQLQDNFPVFLIHDIKKDLNTLFHTLMES